MYNKKASIGSTLFGAAAAVGKGLTGGVVESISKGIGDSAIKAVQDQMVKKKGLAMLEHNPFLKSQYEDISLMKNVGFGSKDFKEYQEYQNKLLEHQKLTNELSKENTILGKFSRTNVGQFTGPFLGGSAAAIGGTAALGVGSFLSQMNVPNPIVNSMLKIKFQEVLRANPMLANFDRGLLFEYYQLIYNHAPSVANNPRMVAGLLERAMNYGGIDHNLLKELAETEKAVREPMKGQLDRINLGNNIFKTR